VHAQCELLDQAMVFVIAHIQVLAIFRQHRCS
jgi:hypothetical protein